MTSFGDNSLTGPESAHCVHDVLYGGGLVQHARRARLHRSGEAARVQARAQDQRRDPRLGSGEILNQSRPISIGQTKIHDHDIHPAERSPSLGHGPHLPNDGELRLPLEHESQRLTERDVVLHQQDADLFCRVVLYGACPSIDRVYTHTMSRTSRMRYHANVPFFSHAFRLVRMY